MPKLLAAAPVDAQAFLASTDMFAGLSGRALEEAASGLEWLHAVGGEVLFRQGEVGAVVYLVASGGLRAVRETKDGHQRVLREIGRGGSVGELGLLIDVPRSTTVRVIGVTTLARLSRARFHRLLACHPSAAVPLTRTLTTWLRNDPLSETEDEAAALLPPPQDVLLESLALRLCQPLALTAPLCASTGRARGLARLWKRTRPRDRGGLERHECGVPHACAKGRCRNDQPAQ
jgi:NTE family protein